MKSFLKFCKSMQNISVNTLRIAFEGRFLKRTCLLGFILLGSLLLPAQGIKNPDRASILEVMRLQEQAWNDGDLEGFMNGYWHSDSLRFIGSKGITYGWQSTLDNYKRGYPDRAAMGKLTFTILRVEGMGKRCAHVTGQWHLQRAQDAPQGYFTLVWRKLAGQWVIVADHSS
jgi:ketosteroid isomerase-like protein